MATSGENYWPPTGRTSWPLTPHLDRDNDGIACE
ncbi:excalibur calcium-binding domain-containing protein [Rhodococcus qingshengii]